MAGLVQGITLVTFPAASSIVTDPTEYDLSNTRYGAIFLPQVVTAIATSLLSARLADRFSSKQVLLVGLAATYSHGLAGRHVRNQDFGVGRLVDRGVSLSALYGWAAVAAGAMALLSFAVAGRQASPRELHPRPAGHEQPADSGG